MGKARRRGSGEGTITQREDGRWMGQLSLGFNPVTGKRQRQAVYGDTQAEVRDKLDELKRRFWEGGPVVESSLPLSQFLTDVWLPSIKDSVVERSYDRYAQDVTHVVTYLGSRRLDQLTGLDVTNMYRAMDADGHSTATRRSVGRLLRQALGDACKRKYVRENVAQQVPVAKHHKADIHPLTPAQVAHLLDSLRGDRLYALVVVALDSGARVGELLALEWSDWDPATRELSVTKTLVVHKGKPPYARQPKTPSSRRRILLSRTAAAVLDAVLGGGCGSSPDGGSKLGRTERATCGQRPEAVGGRSPGLIGF